MISIKRNENQPFVCTTARKRKKMDNKNDAILKFWWEQQKLDLFNVKIMKQKSMTRYFVEIIEQPSFRGLDSSSFSQFFFK